MPATPLGPGTWCLDLEFQGYAGAVAAFLLHDGDGLALGQVKATHGALGEIDLYQWTRFIADHEAHHERQIRAIAETLAPTG